MYAMVTVRRPLMAITALVAQQAAMVTKLPVQIAPPLDTTIEVAVESAMALALLVQAGTTRALTSQLAVAEESTP